MQYFLDAVAIFTTFAIALWASMKQYKWGFYLEESSITFDYTKPMPPTAPASLLFDTPQHAYHSTRVLCDEMGLPFAKTITIAGRLFAPKDIICACIYQESNFYNYLPNGNPVIHQNLAKDGKTVLSTDWGICQINDHYHVGPHLDFSSSDFVMQNPAEAVRFMIRMYKVGLLKQWVSYSSGAYEQWLAVNSPLWKLAV